MSDDSHGHTHDDNCDHDHGDPRLIEGWAALDEGHLDLAKAKAAELLKEAEVDAEAYLFSAAVAREEGDEVAALAQLTLAEKADPEWGVPLLWRAELVAGQGDLKGALKLATDALDLVEDEDDFLSAIALKATLELQLDRGEEAAETLESLPPADVALPDPGLAIELSVLLLEVGDAEGAKGRLELALRDDPSSAEGWHVLGLAAEALGEDELRTRAWLEARRLDLEEDEASPAKERDGLDDEALEKIAESVLGDLSEDLRAKLGNVPVVIAEVPAADDVQAGLDPRTLAIFEGTPLAERDGTAQVETTRIVLFRANLGRIAPDAEVLEEEIRTTLMHEVGHFLGLDEEALEKAGLA